MCKTLVTQQLNILFKKFWNCTRSGDRYIKTTKLQTSPSKVRLRLSLSHIYSCRLSLLSLNYKKSQAQPAFDSPTAVEPPPNTLSLFHFAASVQLGLYFKCFIICNLSKFLCSFFYRFFIPTVS